MICYDEVIFKTNTQVLKHALTLLCELRCVEKKKVL